MSLKDKIGQLGSNSLKKFEYTTTLDDKDAASLADALKTNTSCTEVVLANVGISDGVGFAAVLSENKTILKLDLGYNKLDAVAITLLCEALKTNSSLTELKIHRQETDMGPICEETLASIYLTNTTLTRCYATLHNRKFNGDNTRGEVRNKEIFRRKEQGKDWLDLDPARKEEYMKVQEAARAEEASALALANAPISARVESTGGPYTMKQLTCKIDFLPEDVPSGSKETFLSDTEFEAVFKMDKAAFAALPGWKKTTKKKEAKIN